MQSDAPIDWMAVDWGTTHMRAYAMAADGTVVGKANGQGMRDLAGGDFEAALLQAIAPWLPAQHNTTATSPIAIVMCGMVGSRQGWQEARYLAVPHDLSKLGDALTEVPTNDARLNAWIVPGLSQRDPFDVMRGEETQIAGYLAQNMSRGEQSTRLCLPGTHAKWARLDGQKLTHFSTAMTGELFDLLSNQSLLSHSVVGTDIDSAAFEESVLAAFQKPACLTEALFSIRAEGLLTEENPARARGRLSGLLIGAELAGADLVQDEPIALIGAEALCRAYATALHAIGWPASVHDGEALVLGGLTSLFNQMIQAGKTANQRTDNRAQSEEVSA